MKMSIRVVVISSRMLVRAGLVSLLSGQPQVQVVGETDNLSHAAPRDVDVVLWDVGKTKPQAISFRFLALLSEPNDAQTWLKVGAAGCVLETASVEELLSAIRQVARGEMFLSPPIVQMLVWSSDARREGDQAIVEPLTEREREVLRLLAQGLNNKDIAQKLYLSVRTVEGHLANIYGKLHLKSRTEAALWAARHL
jgi:DNA-binding NarL/FixJ family response regulator